MTLDGRQRAEACWETWVNVLGIARAQKNAIEALGRAWDDATMIRRNLKTARRRLTIAMKKQETPK